MVHGISKIWRVVEHFWLSWRVLAFMFAKEVQAPLEHFCVIIFVVFGLIAFNVQTRAAHLYSQILVWTSELYEIHSFTALNQVDLPKRSCYQAGYVEDWIEGHLLEFHHPLGLSNEFQNLCLGCNCDSPCAGVAHHRASIFVVLVCTLPSYYIG